MKNRQGGGNDFFRFVGGGILKNGALSYLKRFLNLAFGFEGLLYAVRREKNIQMLLFFEAILFGIIIWHGAAISEIFLLLLGFTVLNVLEIFNSAVEKLADLVQPNFDLRIKLIKDLLSGGIIFMGAMAIFIWAAVIFL